MRFSTASDKLEHIRIRGTEKELMRIYITGRNAYVEVHGFQLKLIPQPDCSVIQGSKCNTTLYTIYTLDVTELETVMKEPETYKTIVGKDKTVTNITEQSSTGYIDEVRHVIGATNKDTQEIHMNDLYALLKMVYSNKQLKMNGEKANFLTINSKHDDTRPGKLKS